jgi:uncharacterized membrane protein
MSAPARTTVGRLSYIDWMRGLAILVMIEAHVFDAWTRPSDRQSLAFGVSAVLAGFAAPMFLFLAGVSVALAVALMTPLIRTASWVDSLPLLAQWYLRPTPGRNNFTLFPWAGFVLAGAAIGVIIDQARGQEAEQRLHRWMAPGALLFAAACYAGSYLPSIYADSRFWTSSPMFFLLRVGVVTFTLSALYFYERRPRLLGARWPWASPMVLFGQASLFVYWVHVEMVYGVVSGKLHRSLSFPAAVAAFAVFSVAMFGLAVFKNAAVARWKQWRAAVATAPPSMVEKA